jgi:hypothetical protein
MATGNHYLLDAIAGAVIMGAGALLAVALRHGDRTAATETAAAAETLDASMTERAAAPARVAAPATSAARLRCTTERETPAVGQPDAGLCRPRL